MTSVFGVKFSPWKTVNYSNIKDNKNVYSREDYNEICKQNPEIFINGQLLQVITVDKAKDFYSSKNPFGLCFNFITFEKPINNRIIITDICIYDNKGRKLNNNLIFPLEETFKEEYYIKNQVLYIASIVTDYDYYFKGRKNEKYKIDITFFASSTNEETTISTVIEPYVKGGLFRSAL